MSRSPADRSQWIAVRRRSTALVAVKETPNCALPLLHLSGPRVRPPPAGVIENFLKTKRSKSFVPPAVSRLRAPAQAARGQAGVLAMVASATSPPSGPPSLLSQMLPLALTVAPPGSCSSALTRLVHAEVASVECPVA